MPDFKQVLLSFHYMCECGFQSHGSTKRTAKAAQKKADEHFKREHADEVIGFSSHETVTSDQN